MDIFALPENLLLLLLLLPLGALIWLSWRFEAQDRRALGDERVVGTLLQTPAARRRRMRSIMLLAALALIVVALARPRLGRSDEQLHHKGLQVMIVLDSSLSMAVQDADPSRFEAAKQIILDLFDAADGNQFGMVVFGKSSQVQFPLTSDLAAARNLVAPLTLESLSSPGSNVAGALEEAQRSFIPGQTAGRMIVLLSDGGDPEDDPSGKTELIARQAASAGILIHTIGVGSSDGGPIPYRDQDGRLRYKEDQSGNQVVSRLNDSLLRTIAGTTGGSYFNADGLSMSDLMTALDRGAPVELADRQALFKQERFQILAALALLLLSLEYLQLGRGGLGQRPPAQAARGVPGPDTFHQQRPLDGGPRPPRR